MCCCFGPSRVQKWDDAALCQVLSDTGVISVQSSKFDGISTEDRVKALRPALKGTNATIGALYSSTEAFEQRKLLAAEYVSEQRKLMMDVIDKAKSLGTSTEDDLADEDGDAKQKF